ncbi:MAG: GtrA family protein [Candidatus Sedimenticola sp. PURPLELP]
MRSLISQGSRFAVVGLVATIAHYLTIFVVVDVLDLMKPTPATVAGGIFGITIAYIGNYKYVFCPANANHRQLITVFLMVYTVVILLHAGFMYLFTEVLSMPYEYGFIVATFFSAATSFLANRFVVFKTGPEPKLSA